MKTKNGYDGNIRICCNNCDDLMTLTGQILDVYKNPGIYFLVVAWGQLSFVKLKAIREDQVTSCYDKFFETCFYDQFLCLQMKQFRLVAISFWEEGFPALPLFIYFVPFLILLQT